MKKFSYSIVAKHVAKYLSLSLVAQSALMSTQVNAEDDVIEDIEVITISHQRHKTALNTGIAQGKTSAPDLANWLSSIPGGNVNRNGPVTGIAQYRGLYGDRVATTLDGHTIIGAGPNAMDTPLSYSTPLIVDSMTVYRSIAPVSAGIDTLGGAIEVNMRKAETSSSQNVVLDGDLQAGYRSNNDAKTWSAVANAGKKDFGILLYGNVQSGNDMESGDSVTIDPTEYQKRQFGTDIRYNSGGYETGLSYHYTDTQDSGTPALPMDIEYIYSHRVNLDGNFMLGNWQANWQLGYLDADHGMTNFLMRENNNMMKYRRNNAVADTKDFKVEIEQEFSFGTLQFGVDGYFSEHDSIITNPHNAMFKVVNFNGVEDERFGLYGQWLQSFDQLKVQLGARVKHSRADAGEVFSSMAMMSMPMDNGMSDEMGSGMETGMNPNMGGDMPAMPSMGDLAKELMDNFNNADRDVDDTKVDLALSLSYQLSAPLSLYAGFGLKHRAPSYQERYLWTPMEATGGLADGNTYIGDINLDSEKAYQTDFGLTYQTEKFSFAPHIFYQRIDDYIQGTPMGMEDMTARMMASMMSGNETPLKFTNVDAKLYGADVNWHYQLLSDWRVSGIINYVKGERRDINDDLYRIAPLNGQLALSYQYNELTSNLTLVAAASQDDVSITNNEQKTAGYALVNLDVVYHMDSSLTLRGGVDNLLDKEYQNHLGGYNRVKGTEIDVMSRLPAEGLSAWAEVTYSF